MTVRVESTIRHAAETIAATLDRDRNSVVWQIEHIRSGLREANAGMFVPEREMRRVIGRLRRR